MVSITTLSFLNLIKGQIFAFRIKRANLELFYLKLATLEQKIGEKVNKQQQDVTQS